MGQKSKASLQVVVFNTVVSALLAAVVFVLGLRWALPYVGVAWVASIGTSLLFPARRDAARYPWRVTSSVVTVRLLCSERSDLLAFDAVGSCVVQEHCDRRAGDVQWRECARLIDRVRK